MSCYYFALSVKENTNTLAFIAKQTILIGFVFAVFLQVVHSLVFSTKITQIIDNRLISILSLE
jgi:hypothetical protein